MARSLTPHRPGRRRSALLVLAAVLALSTLACSDDGKTLREPPPGATAPLRSTSTTVAGGTGSTVGPTPGLLSLTSTDFQPGAPLAEDATCRGDQRSPALAWSGLPDDTVEVAIVVTDADAELFTNWIVAGIDPTIASIAAGVTPENAVESLNDEGETGYVAPCPDEDETHIIEFTLYALSAPSGVTADMTSDEARAALDESQGSRAVVTAIAEGG